MRPSDAHSFRRTANNAVAGLSSVCSTLSSLRGLPAQVLFLTLATPQAPVAQMSARLEQADPSGVVLALDGCIPRLDSHVRFGVEILAPAGLVRFRCRAAKPVAEGDPTLTLHLPEKIDQLQRRRFVRAPFSGTIHYDQISGTQRFPGGQATGIDLSAGGLRMVTPSAIGVGRELVLGFEPLEGRHLRGIRATVVRVERRRERWAIACRFDSLSKPQEVTLVQAVFRLQLRSPVQD